MHRTGLRYLFSGGGTGGHLFPAVAVAEQIRFMDSAAQFMFVGTKHKIESRVVPQLGFAFKSVWIQGINRQLTLTNLLFPVKIVVSFFQGLWINMRFKPDVAVGSGGYASFPAIIGASIMGAKIVLLEQNSYPGLTTRLLERYADEIHISFAESAKYFRNNEKLQHTGNPVRVSGDSISRESAVAAFGLNPARQVLLVLGGSLGARTINSAVAQSLSALRQAGLQVLWQTGQQYFEQYRQHQSDAVKVLPFIEDMNTAYAAAGLLLARAGATTIAEITARGMAAVLVPSPNVANDHQRFNAHALAAADAAEVLEDANLGEALAAVVTNLAANTERRERLALNAAKLGKPNAAQVIAGRVMRLAEEGRGLRA